MQLTLDGREVEHITVGRPGAPLTGLQREILRELAARGEITTVAAGTLVHRARRAQGGHCGIGGRDGRYSGAGCCAYAAADGLEALKRLERRGLVAHPQRGRWVAR